MIELTRQGHINRLMALLDSGLHLNIEVSTSIMLPPGELAPPRTMQDLPNNTVSVEQYDGVVRMLDASNAALDTLREQCRCLKAEKTELLDTLDEATTPGGDEEVAADHAQAMLAAQKKVVTKRTFKAGAKTARGKPRRNNTLLTDEQVWGIRRFSKMGRESAWIAKHLSLPYATVHKVSKGNTYASVPAEPERKPTIVKAGVGVVK